MAMTGAIGIVADDLTGANDTALQFFIKGSNTEIIFDTDENIQNHPNIGTFALTTESRNINAKEAAQKVWEGAKKLKDNLSVEYFYKKIDSTLRGNIAVETLAMLDAIGYDAAVIAPAFIREGRITIGGYQLLKGVPIERTDAARDSYAPIYDSYIPDILKKQVNESFYDSIATIQLNVIAKGAGPITSKLNELVSGGKKLIVIDAVSAIDLEQIVLAITKSQYNILPVGSAGLANALGNVWLPLNNSEPVQKIIPKLPKLILSGSKNSMTTAQINKLLLDDDIDNVYSIDLKLQDILSNDSDAMAERIIHNFGKDNIVIAHVSKIQDETQEEKGKEKLIDEGITKEMLASMITDYLANIAQKVKKMSECILITIGGETSYKCTNAVNCEYLQVVDSILPAISLCMDSNAGFIVTKSGNMGSITALVDIVNYFKNHEQK
ncbi:TPA: four-carbon acid sugar kinase family protein [Candidatus Galligastranaerophilus intestinigallinarum]|nr:four-carbon acid sugar kinase family protein [Candidatus Galligastranaerophilus intestinigallinarum]